MQILPIIFNQNSFQKNKNGFCSQKLRNTMKSYAGSEIQNPNFTANMNKLAYEASLSYHYGQIFNVDPYRMEQFFARNNITAFFREGTDFGKRMVAYCCYHATKIFEQLHYPKPRALGIVDFRRIPNQEGATGLSFFGSQVISPYETYKPFTAIFNTFYEKRIAQLPNGKKIPLDWEHFIEVMEASRQSGFLSSGHFLGPFIHEYAHNLHYHKIFSKYGSFEPVSGYRFNPDAINIFKNLNKDLYNQEANSNYIASYLSSNIPKHINQEIGYYASTSLPETFAEAFTKELIKNLDPYSLRLVKNPFPMKSKNELVNKVLYETYEGLAGDGKGVI